MPEFFSYILKQKKIILFAFLIFVLAGISMPHVATANIFTDTFNAIVNLPENIVNWLLKLLFILPIVALIVAQFITGLFAILVATTLKIVLILATNVSYTSLDPSRNLAVSLGWPIARNFANMAIVLGFIVVAVATILRFEEYGAKKVLAKLIIVAILVNFSLVICGVVIDASNIVMNFFLGNTEGSMSYIFSDVGLSFQFIDQLANTVINLLSWNVGAMDIMFRMMGSIFYNVMATVVYALFTFLFLFRIIALWILVILSPIALVTYVFPNTKSMVFDKWWSHFVMWCFVGATGAFFLMIGMRLMVAMNAAGGQLITTDLLSNNLPPGFWAGLGAVTVRSLTRFFGFFIPGVFLIMGFLFALQMSAIGSAVAIGAYKASAKYARMGGKWAADKYGITRRAQAIGDRVSLGLERAGILRDGTTAGQQRDRHKEALGDKDRTSRVEAMNLAARLDKIRRRNDTGQSGLEAQYDRAKIVEEMAKDGQLSELRTALAGTPGAFEEVIRETHDHGVRTREIAKSDYRAAEFDDERVAEYIRDNPATPAQIASYIVANPITNGAPTTNAQAQQALARRAVRGEQLEQNISGMNRRQKGDIDPGDLTPEVISGGYFTQNIIRDFQSAPAPVKNALRNAITAPITGIDAQLAVLRAVMPAVNQDRNEIRRLETLRTSILRLR